MFGLMWLRDGEAERRGALRGEAQGVDGLADISADGGRQAGGGKEGQGDGSELHDGGELVVVGQVSGFFSLSLRSVLYNEKRMLRLPRCRADDETISLQGGSRALL